MPKQPTQRIARTATRGGKWYYVRRIHGQLIRRSLDLDVETTTLADLRAARNAVDAIIDGIQGERQLGTAEDPKPEPAIKPTIDIPNPEPDRILMKDILARMLVMRDLKKHTHKNYQEALLRFLRWADDYDIFGYADEITPIVVKQYCLDSRARGESSNTARMTVRTISTLFSFAIEEEIIDGINPVSVIKVRRYLDRVPQRIRYLTTEQWDALLAAADHYHPEGSLRLMIEAAAYTGLRRGELFALTWDDIEDGTVAVRQSKTDRERRVPITPPMSRVLDELRRRNVAQQVSHAKASGAETIFPISRPVGYVFYGRWTYDVYSTTQPPEPAWRAARDAAGLQDFRWHDLRHHAAYLFLRAGLDIYTLSKVLGHASVKTTEIYSHLAVSDIKAKVNALFDTA